MKRKAEDEDENEVKLEFTNAYSKLTIPIPEGTVKVTKDMIYTIAMHPSVDKIIAGVGDKTGALAFWDVSETLEKCERGEEEEEPVVAMFKPHARPVSKVMYHTTDLKKIFTSSYDGSVRCMDVDAQHLMRYETVYVHPEETMVTSFDIDPTGRTVWFLRRRRHLRRPRPPYPHIPSPHSLPQKAQHRFVEALRSYRHGKSVNSAFWDASGKHVLSLSFDDTIREIKIRHNNNTGRWIQKFKAVWKETPDESLFVVGNMHRSVDIYSGTGSPLSILSSPDKLTAIPAVNVFHPSPAVRMIVSGNASGRMTVWI
ncbi:WD40-repeat-containing domain protein [Chytridium lagenaria]|nr:WD40-repeat-containing domain protein [Chytridium lagenaria]